MRTRLLAALLLMTMALGAFQPLPRCTSVEPDTGKKGDVVAVKGENLGKKSIGELYLTDGKNDTKVEISDQSDAEIKFKVPDVKPGRYHLVTLSANKSSMIEQPVVLAVE
jgi:hypothetical protein